MTATTMQFAASIPQMVPTLVLVILDILEMVNFVKVGKKRFSYATNWLGYAFRILLLKLLSSKLTYLHTELHTRIHLYTYQLLLLVSLLRHFCLALAHNSHNSHNTLLSASTSKMLLLLEILIVLIAKQNKHKRDWKPVKSRVISEHNEHNKIKEIRFCLGWTYTHFGPQFIRGGPM